MPDQFAPGTYRVEGYWARLDVNQEIIDNDLVDSGLTLMNVAPTDAYVEINGAALALADLPHVDPIAEGWTDGTYWSAPTLRLAATTSRRRVRAPTSPGSTPTSRSSTTTCPRAT